ncbi:hypothetical protein [Succinivibrio sp.]|uniref:hypothetical protein n=1 Tax=Succinivibrio sp. TaxID=2053619 RepID=UPI003869186F
MSKNLKKKYQNQPMIKPRVLALDEKKEYSLIVEVLGKLNGWSPYGFCLYTLLKAIKEGDESYKSCLNDFILSLKGRISDKNSNFTPERISLLGSNDSLELILESVIKTACTAKQIEGIAFKFGMQLKSMSIKEQLQTITGSIVLTERGNLLLNSIEEKTSMLFSNNDFFTELFDKVASDTLETVERELKKDRV